MTKSFLGVFLCAGVLLIFVARFLCVDAFCKPLDAVTVCVRLVSLCV